MNRKKFSIAALAIALSVGTVSTASANQVSAPRVGGTQVSSVLSTLVKAGTITQAQSDAITSALASAHIERSNWMSADRSARMTLIASTLGLDVATLQAKLKAGASLASLAGTNTNALITALAAFEAQKIDAAVTAGKITATQATAMKANLVVHETHEVNAVGHFGHFGQIEMRSGNHAHGVGMMH
jgi:polyhydroxyalkanoate synthesis regulator phasin